MEKRNVTSKKGGGATLRLLPMPGDDAGHVTLADGERRRTEAAGAQASTCKGLRRERLTGRLVSVNRPATAYESDATPFGVVNHATAGRILFTADDDGMLKAVYLDRNNLEYELDTVEGAPRYATLLSDNCVAVVTDREILEVGINPNGTFHINRRPEWYSTLHFATSSEATMTAKIASRRLSGVYTSRSSCLDANDSRNLSADLLDGYDRLCRAATAGGLLMQPTLARYRLEDVSGATLYVSPAVAVGPSTGFQCLQEFSADIPSGMSHRGEITIGAKVCRLNLKGNISAPMTNATEIERLVVELSSPAHIVDFDAAAANALDAGAENGATLRCFIPGASTTMVATAQTGAERLRRMAAAGDSAFVAVATVTRPFRSAGSFDIDINPSGGLPLSASKQLSLCEKRLATSPIHPEANLCRLPHSFTARTASRVADTIVWGNITSRLWQGPSPAAIGVDHATQTWRGYTATELADGTLLVRIASGSGNAPVKLSPVLCYPLPGAVAMTVTVERGGTIYSRRFELRRCGNASVWVSADGTAPTLSAVGGQYIAPQSTAHDIEMPSTLIAAPLTEPLSPRYAFSPGAGAVTALAAYDRRSGAWSFAAKRLYVMTRTGTFIVNLNADGRWTSAHRIDSRPVASARAVAEVSDNRYNIVVVAGGDLVAINNCTTTTLCRNAKLKAVAWDAVDGELWCITDDGRLQFRSGCSGGIYDIAHYGADRLLASDKGVLAWSSESIDDTSRDRIGANATVEYTVEIPLGTTQRMRWLEVDLDSDSFSGAIVLSCRAGRDTEPFEACRIEIAGVLRRPVTARLLTPPCSIAIVTITGRAAPGTTIRSITLK